MQNLSLLRSGNAILQQIEPQILVQFSDRIHLVRLERRTTLHDVGDDIEWVYFPVTGLIGVVSETANGDAVQNENIGCSGVLGAFAACGSRKGLNKAVVDIPGSAWRVSAPAYRDLFQASAGLRTAIHRHVELLLARARQGTTCNALHNVEGRLCRTILDLLDASCTGASLPVGQATLAQMLGVQRTTVTFAVSALQEAAIVRSRRGGLEVMDRKGLEQRACSCWASLQFLETEISSSNQPVCEAS